MNSSKENAKSFLTGSSGQPGSDQNLSEAVSKNVNASNGNCVLVIEWSGQVAGAVFFPFVVQTSNLINNTGNRDNKLNLKTKGRTVNKAEQQVPELQ